jgi:hypothetical protein
LGLGQTMFGLRLASKHVRTSKARRSWRAFFCTISTNGNANDFQKEKRPPTLGGLVKEEKSSRALCHKGAAHNLNNTIAVGTLIHVKHAVIAQGLERRFTNSQHSGVYLRFNSRSIRSPAHAMPTTKALRITAAINVSPIL